MDALTKQIQRNERLAQELEAIKARNAQRAQAIAKLEEEIRILDNIQKLYTEGNDSNE